MDGADKPQIDGTVDIEGNEVVGFAKAVEHVTHEHPEISVTTAQALVISELEAITGGTPVAVPKAVLTGVEELIADGLPEPDTDAPAL